MFTIETTSYATTFVVVVEPTGVLYYTLSPKKFRNLIELRSREDFVAGEVPKKRFSHVGRNKVCWIYSD